MRLLPFSRGVVAIPSPAVVKSTVRPSGRISGQLAGPPVTSDAGMPPAALTFANPPPRRANTIVPSAPQLAPLPEAETLQILRGTPPATATFWSAPLAKKPTHRPSGEKNGCAAAVVPSTTLG